MIGTGGPAKRKATSPDGDEPDPAKVARLATKVAESSATGEAPQASAPKARDGAAADETIGSPPIKPIPLDILSVPLTEFLHHIEEAGNYEEQNLANWVQHNKAIVNAMLIKFLRHRHAQVSFSIPADVLDFEPLGITAAASGSMLSGFREVMHYTHLQRSLEK